VTPGLVFGPLAILRATQALLVIAFIVVARPAWRLPGSLVPAVLLIGLLDMGGNAFFIAARQSGELAIAATLSSLYPVTTTILAAVILRERIGRAHAVGIVAAAIAVALIAAGAAGSG
jgi:drug/metabolite transporter (DMT)-like permease